MVLNPSHGRRLALTKKEAITIGRGPDSVVVDGSSTSCPGRSRASAHAGARPHTHATHMRTYRSLLSDASRTANARGPCMFDLECRTDEDDENSFSVVASSCNKQCLLHSLRSSTLPHPLQETLILSASLLEHVDPPGPQNTSLSVAPYLVLESHREAFPSHPSHPTG